MLAQAILGNVTGLLDTSHGGSVGNSVDVVLVPTVVNSVFQCRATKNLAWWTPLQAPANQRTRRQAEAEAG